MIALLSCLAAAAPGSAGYALVIGSNHGGEGQESLRFAVRDAERVGEVLVELGRFGRDNVLLLAEPTPEEVDAALATLEAAVSAHAARGEKTRFLFYFSGHARASGLSLGDRSLDIGVLREQLAAVPATVTITVLDACQSGAFSRVKGAEPTAEFSYNVAAQLRSEGDAVLASSTASEMSQESETLGSSFFTHHLLTALRGAGDTDTNGQVTLAEAYHYAYNHTLAATAATAVGSQHATMESTLRGTGELVLTYPGEADATLALPADFGGQLLVYQAVSRVVMAEVHKAQGMPMRLALPAGDYVVLLRHGDGSSRCPVRLAPGAPLRLEPARCERQTPAGAAKGAPAATVNLRAGPAKDPVLAVLLATLPLPLGLGHVYTGDWWPHGAFFAALEAAELAIAAGLLVRAKSPGESVRGWLYDRYRVVPVQDGTLDEAWLAGAAVAASLFVATKVWEVVDARWRAAATAVTAPAALTLAPWTHGAAAGGVTAVVRF